MRPIARAAPRCLSAATASSSTTPPRVRDLRSSCCTAPPRWARVTGGHSARSLRKHFRLFMPDARAHGRDPLGRQSRAGAARCSSTTWRAFVDGLGLERFRLMGLSMGGATALAFAMRHPERVEALVVVSAANEIEPARSVARRPPRRRRPSSVTTRPSRPSSRRCMTRPRAPVPGAVLLARPARRPPRERSAGPGVAGAGPPARPARLRRPRPLGPARAGRAPAPPAARGSAPRRARRPCRAGRASVDLQSRVLLRSCVLRRRRG